MSIGERIISLRKEQNMSQGQLADALEVSRQAVSKWENDQAAPDSLKMIRLAEVLDTDIEYLSTGRRNFGRRPPVVIRSVETVEVEKIVEKPVLRTVEVEKVVEKVVEIPVKEYVDRPVIKKVYRKQYVRNPIEFLICGGIFFLLGMLIGVLL